jgi:hypothetical protein
MLRNVKERNAEWIKVRDKRESIYDANISIVRELWDLHFLYTVLGESLDMGGENLTPSTELFSNDVAIIMGKKKP